MRLEEIEGITEEEIKHIRAICKSFRAKRVTVEEIKKDFN